MFFSLKSREEGEGWAERERETYTIYEERGQGRRMEETE